MRERVGVKVVKALKRQDDAVTHAAVDMLCALMQVRFIFWYFSLFIYILHSNNIFVNTV